MSRHKAEICCSNCGEKLTLTVTLDGAHREGETERRPTPIVPVLPELKAVLEATTNFPPLGNDKYGAWWATIIKSYDEPYPWLFLDEELRAADSWIESNPRRRPQDLRRFFRTWLGKAVENGRKTQTTVRR